MAQTDKDKRLAVAERVAIIAAKTFMRAWRAWGWSPYDDYPEPPEDVSYETVEDMRRELFEALTQLENIEKILLEEQHGKTPKKRKP